MKKVTPYNNLSEAISKLDNGGRFYNLLTKAEDGVISKAELGKVGGIFNDKQKMILFLELSISDLSRNEKQSILSKLDTSLQTSYQKYEALRLLSSEAQQKGEIASNAIITGVPKLSDSESKMMGFIMVPIVVGSVTTFSMIPLMEQYDIYELRDEESSKSVLIAHTKSSEKLPAKKIKVAGVFKELRSSEDEDTPSKKFLEVLYYLD